MQELEKAEFTKHDPAGLEVFDAVFHSHAVKPGFDRVKVLNELLDQATNAFENLRENYLLAKGVGDTKSALSIGKSATLLAARVRYLEREITNETSNDPSDETKLDQ